MPRLLALALILPTLWWQSAVAQVSPKATCVPRPTLVAQLQAIDAWQAARGVSEGRVVEWWGAPDGRWMLFVTTPTKIACVLARGRGFHLAKPKYPMEPRL